MSIYLYTQNINEKIKKNVVKLRKIDIIASAIKNNKKIELHYEEYNEDKLKNFCQNRNHNNIKVHPYFWNHNYCNISMIYNEEKIYNLDEPDTIILNINYFSSGRLVMFNVFFNILSLTYCLDNKKEYKNYLDKLNIDRTIFANFLINNKFNFPLTENYLILIKRIFTNDNIVDYVFETNYNFKQIALILNSFDYGSINILSSYIFTSKLSDSEKLCLCQELLRNYNDNIDVSSHVSLNMKNFKPYLIYYLYTMNIPEDLINSYYYTWNMVLDNKGASKLTINDDIKLNEKIKQRYQVIKDNFNL